MTRADAARRLLQLLALDAVGDLLDQIADDDLRRLVRQAARRAKLIADDAVPVLAGRGETPRSTDSTAHGPR